MCTCGNASYASRTPANEEVRSRWRRIPAEGVSYGRFELPVANGRLELYCASCGRVRRSRPVGGGTAMAYTATVDQVRVVMTDVVAPSCMAARLTGLEGRYTLDISAEQVELAVAGAPLEQASAVPVDAVGADYVYTIALPLVATTAMYRLVLVDHCLQRTQFVADLLLTDGVHTLYGRSGDVVAVVGDYQASQIDTAVPDVSLADALSAMQAALDARASRTGDLGGTQAAPLVVGIQGRPASASMPVDGAALTFVGGAWGHSL